MSNRRRSIHDLYKHLTYFDQYGTSVFLLIIVTICLLSIVSYCYIITNMQSIKDDWINQRCKPYIIPFAGIINAPDGTSSGQFTSENFNYCTQNILQDVTADALIPLTFVTNVITTTLNAIKDSINMIRAMFDKIRTFFQDVAQEIMGRIMNVMVALQQIIISFRDFLGKIQGILTASLFTSLGAYYTLKALMGAIAQFIIAILIALAALIIMFWIFPLTWGAAIANTAIFVALSIPMALILTFMMDVLKVHPDLSMPSVPSMKCFDKNVVFLLKCGEKKKASEIRCGDVLINGEQITSKIVVEAKGSHMYNLNGVVVSDSHKVIYNDHKVICNKKDHKVICNKKDHKVICNENDHKVICNENKSDNVYSTLISVCDHPDAKKIHEYNEPFLYCFKTNTKRIVLNDTVYADWDDLTDLDIVTLKKRMMDKNFDKNLDKNKCLNKRFHLDSGFASNIEIKLLNGTCKAIKDVIIGDVLEHGEKVYGKVEIDGIYLIPFLKEDNNSNNFSQKTIGTNISSEDNKQKHLLYHLLTDNKYFHVNNVKVHDYDAFIDMFLESERK